MSHPPTRTGRVLPTRPVPESDSGRVLEARSVSKSFGAVRALVDAEIVVRPGRVHALVGENGAGKSTLAKILAGIERADAAAMTLGDGAYAPHDRADAKLLGIDMVPQQLSLVGELTLVENFLLTGRSAIARRSRARAELAEALERAGVRVDLDVPTSALSQAHRQLGEIVVALAEGATTLILDEPTASLGPLEVGGLFAHLRALCELGTAVLLITHRLDEVRQVADEVTVLSHGRVVHNGPAAGLEPARIAELMVGDLPEPAVRARREPGPTILSARGLSAASRRDASLVDVSLEVRSGEIVGVAGVAGSGQNLLLDVLAGFETPQTGEVRVDETVVSDALGMLRAGVAWIPEERSEAIVPTLTLRENLDVYASARGRRGGSRARGAAHAETLRAFDVRPAQPARAAGGLSGGNQQKLLVARELGTAWAEGETPRVVLAYGPTQGLDLRAAQAVRERLAAASEAGAAVLVASHDLDEILDLADRVLVMFGGRIVADLPASEATTTRLGAAMAGLAEPDIQRPETQRPDTRRPDTQRPETPRTETQNS
jgi:simple sugar transport system ATP-binding protein